MRLKSTYEGGLHFDFTFLAARNKGGRESACYMNRMKAYEH